MAALMKAGAAEFGDANRTAFTGELEVNDAVRVGCAVALVGSDNQRGAAMRGKAEKRLDQASMLESIDGQISEMAKTVHENPLRICLFNHFGYLQAGRLALHFGRSEDVIAMHFRERFGRQSEIQYSDTIDVQTERTRISADLTRKLAECDEKAALLLGSRQKMKTQRGFSGSRITMNKVHPTGQQPATKDMVQTRNTGRDPHKFALASRVPQSSM